jgi:hypothetical protein
VERAPAGRCWSDRERLGIVEGTTSEQSFAHQDDGGKFPGIGAEFSRGPPGNFQPCI